MKLLVQGAIPLAWKKKMKTIYFLVIVAHILREENMTFGTHVFSLLSHVESLPSCSCFDSCYIN